MRDVLIFGDFRVHNFGGEVFFRIHLNSESLKCVNSICMTVSQVKVDKKYHRILWCKFFNPTDFLIALFDEIHSNCPSWWSFYYSYYREPGLALDIYEFHSECALWAFSFSVGKYEESVHFHEMLILHVFVS